MMRKELEILEFIETHLEQHQNVVLLVVVQSSGSSPGRQGFKMVVAEETICGSIGGGVMEMSLVKLAKLKIKNEELKINSDIIEQIHRKDSQNSSGMICSGKQTVIFKKLTKADLKTVRKIIECLEKQISLVLQISNLEFQIIESSKITENYCFSKIGGNEFLYEEKLGFKNQLSIIGGGHCALALSEIMSKLDFRISLFDDRPNLNTLEKNKFAHSIKIIETYENMGEFIDSDSNNYFVVMTLGYKFDEIVIRQLLDKKFKYFGVLGSKAKMKTLLKNLENEGFAKEKLAQIHTPIGLPINSHTPEEIAISIAAEIISIKNSK